MVEPVLRQKLLTRLGVTRQALSKRAKRIKKTYGPMSTDEAVYVIAHLEGLDLSKHLPLTTLDRIRALVPRQSLAATAGPVKASKKKSNRRSKPNTYPLVGLSLIDTATRVGTTVYPLLFVLENSIREFIRIRLSKLDKQWWQANIPTHVQNNVARTMQREQRYPYRERRGDHALYYANFSDLKAIVLANPTAFQDVILDFDWFRVQMDEIYMARNNLAHCVPLSEDDASRIALFNRDWARLLETAGVK